MWLMYQCLLGRRIQATTKKLKMEARLMNVLDSIFLVSLIIL